MLSVTGPNLPGGTLKIWYLEAFCRNGAHTQDWSATTIPHQTELIATKGTSELSLRTVVDGKVEIGHRIQVVEDGLAFNLTISNRADQASDVVWFQPCIRVDRFTGRNQSNYISRCFIFTANGLTTLDRTRRSEQARYRGGQVYVPAGVPEQDVNPRPISPERPINALIGCFSADGKQLLASCWSQTHELFQGVIVCVHNDPRIGGLQPREVKHLYGKLYLMENDPALLLERYRRDFSTR